MPKSIVIFYLLNKKEKLLSSLKSVYSWIWVHTNCILLFLNDHCLFSSLGAFFTLGVFSISSITVISTLWIELRVSYSYSLGFEVDYVSIRSYPSLPRIVCCLASIEIEHFSTLLERMLNVGFDFIRILHTSIW